MDAEYVVFLIEEEHDKMFAVHISEVRGKHPAGIRSTPNLLLLVGHLCFPTGLNLRVSPNEIFQLLALTMMRAPTFDDAQEFGMFCQKQDQIVGLATLYGTTVVVKGSSAKVTLYL